MKKCQYCNTQHEAKCSLIKAIEYHPNGKVKRVEFYEPVASLIPNYNIDPFRTRTGIAYC